VYDSEYKLVNIFTKYSDMIKMYGFDRSNLSRAIKRKIKINGFYITYK
jgi:hypothetical protein